MHVSVAHTRIVHIAPPPRPQRQFPFVRPLSYLLSTRGAMATESPMFGLAFESIVVSTAHLSTPVNVNVIKINGRMFARIVKADSKLQRVLLAVAGLGDCVQHYGGRIYETNVIGQMKALKDAAWDKHMPKPSSGVRRYGNRG